ncbi:MAG: AAA family ATPase [bacterium]
MKAMPIVAVCGKGGVGKTVFSALLARVLMESGIAPLLLIDADPVGGLTSAIGEKVTDTLAGVRDRFIKTARKGRRAKLAQTANQLDYFVLQALVERKGYSLLAMGHNEEKGCFCPANELLRSAINALVPAFAGVLIDAEAGIEQIHRDVTSRVGKIIVVVDASQRSLETLRMIAKMVESATIAVVANRVSSRAVIPIPKGAQWLGSIPENDALRQFDRAGRPLWQLPPENAAVTAVRKIARALGWERPERPGPTLDN